MIATSNWCIHVTTSHLKTYITRHLHIHFSLWTKILCGNWNVLLLREHSWSVFILTPSARNKKKGEVTVVSCPRKERWGQKWNILPGSSLTWHRAIEYWATLNIYCTYWIVSSPEVHTHNVRAKKNAIKSENTAKSQLKTMHSTIRFPSPQRGKITLSNLTSHSCCSARTSSGGPHAQ